MAPALVTGYAVGKLGCFTSGDGCYGIPTDQPYGMHFPNALVPTKEFVHPVPLYETFFNTCLMLYLMVRARNPAGVPVMNNFGVMIMGLGSLRFMLEYVRGHPIIAFGMTEYQFFAGGMMIVGFLVAVFSATSTAHKYWGPMHIPGKSHKKPKAKESSPKAKGSSSPRSKKTKAA